MFLAEGFEESEALVTLDMLRRAGIETLTAGVDSSEIKGAHGISVKTDITAGEIGAESCSGIILPGGMPGTENLFACGTVISLVRLCFEKGRLAAAICAAPIIFGRLGLLNGRRAVCFPGFEKELEGACVCDKPCVRDENIITAKSAGAAFEFSKEIISFVKGPGAAAAVLSSVYYPVKF